MCTTALFPFMWCTRKIYPLIIQLTQDWTKKDASPRACLHTNAILVFKSNECSLQELRGEKKRKRKLRLGHNLVWRPKRLSKRSWLLPRNNRICKWRLQQCRSLVWSLYDFLIKRKQPSPKSEPQICIAWAYVICKQGLHSMRCFLHSLLLLKGLFLLSYRTKALGLAV